MIDAEKWGRIFKIFDKIELFMWGFIAGTIITMIIFLKAI